MVKWDVVHIYHCYISIDIICRQVERDGKIILSFYKHLLTFSTFSQPLNPPISSISCSSLATSPPCQYANQSYLGWGIVLQILF